MLRIHTGKFLRISSRPQATWADGLYEAVCPACLWPLGYPQELSYVYSVHHGYVYYWNSLTIRILNFLLMSLWFCHFVVSAHKSTPKSLRPSGLMEASRFECGSNCSDPELTFPAPAPYPSGPPWGLMSDIWTTAGSLPPRPPRPTRISSSKLWKQQQKIYHPRLISLESS